MGPIAAGRLVGVVVGFMVGETGRGVPLGKGFVGAGSGVPETAKVGACVAGNGKVGTTTGEVGVVARQAVSSTKSRKEIVILLIRVSYIK